MNGIQKLMGASILALLALSSISCASSAAYSRAASRMKSGDRMGAVLSAAESLSHSEKNYKALVLLETAFPEAVAEKKADAETALAGDSGTRWERVVEDWKGIHAMNDAVSSLPPLYRKRSKVPVAFTLEYDRALLERAKESAAEYRYGEGQRLLALGKRSDARQAYEDFQKAREYQAEYKDSAELAEKARELGSDRIAVMPFDSRLRDSESLSFMDMLYGGCQSALVQASKEKNFIQVVERSRLEAILAEQELSSSDAANASFGPESIGVYGANIIVFGQLLSFSSEYPQVKARTESFQVEVEQPIQGAAPVKGVVPKEKVKKSVAVTIFSKRASISAAVSYRAVDLETSVIVESRTLSDGMSDSGEWAIWIGDVEAIPAKYADLVAAKEKVILLPDEMMPRLAAKIDGAFAASFLSSR